MTEPLGYYLVEATAAGALVDKVGMATLLAAVQAAGGRVLVQGGSPEVIEGDRTVSQVMLLEFPSVAAANAFHLDTQGNALAARSSLDRHVTILTGNDPANTTGRKPGTGKGYVYAEMHLTDREKYMEYPKLSTPIVQGFGGTFIVRGGAPHVTQGGRTPGRVVITEFDSPGRAREFYSSSQYQEALKWRLRYAQSHLYVLAGA